MKLNPLCLPDETALLHVVNVLNEIVSLFTRVEIIAGSSSCTNSEIDRLRLITVRVKLLCYEAFQNILKHNHIQINDSRFSFSIDHPGYETLRSSISPEMVDADIFTFVEDYASPETMCTDVNAARELLGVLDRVDEAMLSLLEKVKETKALKKQKEHFYSLRGEILCYASAIRGGIYLDHQKLVQGKTWWKILDSNRRLIRRGLSDSP